MSDSKLAVGLKHVAKVKGWSNASYTDVAKKLRAGENVLAVRAHNDLGDLAARLKPDSETTKSLSPEELQRLRSLGYVR